MTNTAAPASGAVRVDKLKSISQVSISRESTSPPASPNNISNGEWEVF